MNYNQLESTGRTTAHTGNRVFHKKLERWVGTKNGGMHVICMYLYSFSLHQLLYYNLLNKLSEKVIGRNRGRIRSRKRRYYSRCLKSTPFGWSDLCFAEERKVDDCNKHTTWKCSDLENYLFFFFRRVIQQSWCNCFFFNPRYRLCLINSIFFFPTFSFSPYIIYKLFSFFLISSSFFKIVPIFNSNFWFIAQGKNILERLCLYRPRIEHAGASILKIEELLNCFYNL